MKKKITLILLCVVCVFVMLGVAKGCHAKTKKTEDKVVFSWRSSAIENKGKELFALLKKTGANIVYQTIPADADDKTIKNFLKNAYKNGVSVYMLEGDADWSLEYRKTPYVDALNRVEKYNKLVKKKYRIKGVVFDVEPYTLDEWDEQKDDMMYNYVESMKKTYKVAKKKKLSMVACIPYFYEEKGMKKQLIDLIKNGCSEVAVMNYYRKNEKKHIKTEAQYTRKYKKRLINVYEFNPPGKYGLIDINTYYDKGLKTANKNFKKIKKYYKKQEVIMGLHDAEILKELITVE